MGRASPASCLFPPVTRWSLGQAVTPFVARLCRAWGDPRARGGDQTANTTGGAALAMWASLSVRVVWSPPSVSAGPRCSGPDTGAVPRARPRPPHTCLDDARALASRAPRAVPAGGASRGPAQEGLSDQSGTFIACIGFQMQFVIPCLSHIYLVLIS